MTTNNYSLPPDEFKSWQNLYNQLFTIDGKESLIQTDGTKQLVLLPMLTYTIISTMLQKLKYLPNSCFNRIVIGRTPVCGLRTLNRTSPSLMNKLTEILRTMIDGVRKQHILSITMIFYKKDDLNTIYDSYSLVFDYTIKLSDDESQTSIHMIAHVIHQIEYLFSWNDALPNDVELTFVVSALDQFKNKENKIPSPFHFAKQNVKTAYTEHETKHLMGRLTTLDGKIWLKFLPTTHPLSGSSISSEDLIIQKNRFSNKQDIEKEKQSESSIEVVEPNAVTPVTTLPKLRKPTKRSTISTDPSKSGANLPSLSSISSTRSKKKTSFLSAVKSLITPSRTPAPVTSSTPNVADLVLIRHTSTPKPGETASRITIGGKESAAPLSAIYEVSTPAARISSPTPSTLTTTDISTAATPMIAVERRTTVRGQAAVARKKIAAMQIRDDQEEEDDDGDDEEQFKKLFSRQRTKKSKDTAVVPTKKPDDLSDVSSISSTTSNVESLFTPPTGRKRPTTDRTGDDDLAAEHGTPPKTPRTTRRNRIDDQSSIQPTPMDTSDILLNVDSPRLLRSVTKKLQQQASAKKQLAYEEETIASDQSKTQETTKDEEEMDRVYVQLERSSIALHYSMDESD